MHQSLQPILLSLTQQGTTEHGTAGQTPDGSPFVYIVGGLATHQANGAKGIYAVALPFTSAAHIIGIPQKVAALITPADIPRQMVQVDLEGDYPNYFKLFCETDEQSALRYVLDPSAMAHSIDFLQRFHWEILGNTLYFYDDNSLPDLSVVDALISQIEPVNAASPQLKSDFIKEKEKLQPGYVNFDCPLCKQKLQKGKNWLACSNGHGYLLTASQLLETRKDSASFVKQLAAALGKTPEAYTPINPVEHEEITCPNCNHPMVPEQYQYSKFILDVCKNCPYRWIDAAELNPILGAYRHD